MRRLAEAGIETRPFFHPIHRLPPYQGSRVTGGTLPVTDRLAEQGLNLPTFMGLQLDTVDLVCDQLLRCGGGIG
jgi:perosamine synthetase